MVVQAGRSRGSPSARASTPDADGDSFESGLSPLAKAVPRTRSTGDLSQDTNNQVRMMTFQKIIMRLEANPEEILPTWGLMEVGTTRPKQDKTESWDRTVANCGRLPKYWLAQWLVQNDCSIAPLSQTFMDLIDSRDVANVKHMFYLFTLTSATTSIPKPCRESKTLCSKLFTNRLQLIGNPLRDWASKAVDETTGAVDWLVGGAYTLIWEGDFAKEVVFITGDRAPIEDVRITKTFEIKDPGTSCEPRLRKVQPSTALLTSSALAQAPTRTSWTRRVQCWRRWLEGWRWTWSSRPRASCRAPSRTTIGTSATRRRP